MSESSPAPGLLLFARRVGTVLLTLLLLVSGVWTSWSTARHVMSENREQGTLTVTRCDEEQCWGPYVPASPAIDEKRDRVVIDRSIGEHKGVRVPVALKPGTDEAVRVGGAGLLHAWVPLGGALVLAGVVIGGGLRLTRVAWGTGLAGVALLVASFATL